MKFMTPPRTAPLFATAMALCTLVAGEGLAAALALAPPAAIEQRQAGYKKMGSAMKALNAQLKSPTPELAVLAEAAQTIEATAPLQAGWFPAGSGSEAGIDTDALANIWKDRAKFDGLIEQLSAESKQLAATVSGQDLAAVRAQVKQTAAVCGSCHRSFRAD